MRYQNALSSLAALLVLALFTFEGAGCDDGEVAPDGSVNCDDLPADRWEECHDGGTDADSDGDGDSDGDTVETVRMTFETNVPGVLVEILSDVRRCQQEADSSSCDVNVTLGLHEVHLSHPDGWTQISLQISVSPDGIQLLSDVPASIAEAEGFALYVRMDYLPDFTATWRNEEGEVVELFGGCSAEEISPACPNSFCGFYDRGGVLLSGVCVEGETVTLSDYESDLWAEGTVSENAIVVIFHSSYCEPPCGDRFIFTRD